MKKLLLATTMLVTAGHYAAADVSVSGDGRMGVVSICAEGDAAGGAVRYVYATTVGDGPRVLGAEHSLAGADGQPLERAAAGAEGEFDKAL